MLEINFITSGYHCQKMVRERFQEKLIFQNSLILYNNRRELEAFLFPKGLLSLREMIFRKLPFLQYLSNVNSPSKIVYVTESLYFFVHADGLHGTLDG